MVALVRPRSGGGGAQGLEAVAGRLPGVTLRAGDVTDPASLTRDGFAGERFDVMVSCLASRTGVPADAWAIDHRAHVQALAAARSENAANPGMPGGSAGGTASAERFDEIASLFDEDES